MNQLFPKRFRLTKIYDPDGKGLLNIYYLFRGEYELDFGSPIEKETGKFAVRLRDLEFYQIAEGNEDSPQAVFRAKNRLAYFVSDRLKETLGTPSAAREQYIELTSEDANKLKRISPENIQLDQWHDVVPFTKIRQIFVSCGQRTEAEKELGNKISQLIEDLTSYKAYFAQNEANLRGLTENIFKALYQSSGFVAVLHKRDKLSSKALQFEEYRASLWIEQEIAIATFITQELGVYYLLAAMLKVGLEGKEYGSS